MKLAELSLGRNEFNEALERAKEAQNIYALEVKGEFGSVKYYVKEYPTQILFSSLFLLIFGFVSYKTTKLQMIKNKIKRLKSEEKIIVELIQVVQRDTFEKKAMSMEEYGEAISHYESRLSNIIENLIELESKRAHIIHLGGADKALRSERTRVIDMIREIQKLYLKEGKIETRNYELRVQSYSKRLSEIDESLATIEANNALNGKLFKFGGKK